MARFAGAFLLFCLCVCDASAAIARVAGQNKGTTNASATNTYTIAFDNNVTSGNLIVVGVSVFSTTNPDAFIAGDCTKSAGTSTIGTVTLDVQVERNVGGGNYYLTAALFSAPVTGTGSLTMQIVAPGNGGDTYWFVVVNEYSGTDTTGSRVDDTSSSNTGTNSPVVSGTATSTAAGLFVGMLTAGMDGAIGEEAAFTLIAEEEDFNNGMSGSGIDRIVSSSTTDEAEWTVTGLDWSEARAAVLAVYVPAAVGGAAPSMLPLMGVGQ